jgi:DNA-binding response OmpR family regulator
MHRVLVVDDQERILRFTTLSLRLSGDDVIVATCGKDAVTAVRQNKPSIVFLDMLLPDMDGVEVLRQIRTFSDVPVIMSSARVGIAEKAMSLGASYYLPKPFLPEDLIRLIKTILPPED